MDVIIRNVNQKVYRKFKARAAEMGLRLGDALKRAVEAWLTLNEMEVVSPGDPNNQAFKMMRAQLEKRHHGKHIAIANGKLIAVADTFDGLAVELKRRKIERCLTVQVGVEESGEGGEWLWSSIGQETAQPTTSP